MKNDKDYGETETDLKMSSVFYKEPDKWILTIINNLVVFLALVVGIYLR